MTRDELKSMVRELYFYFRLRDPADPDQIDSWLKDLEYIHPMALDFIKAEIKLMDNIPRNLPKMIKGLNAQYNRQNSQNAFVKYDSYDDPRFPILKLHRATEILIATGEDAFVKYCRTNYMPSQDVERCRNKAGCVIDREKVMGLINKTGKKISSTPRPKGKNPVWPD